MANASDKLVASVATDLADKPVELIGALQERKYGAALRVCEDLEMFRSMGQNGNTHSYALHMALYLLEGDPLGARFLYKRAPETLKASDNDLTALWAVNKSIIRGEYESAFANLNVSWSEEIATLIDALRESMRERVQSLLAKSFTGISRELFRRSLGLSEETCDRFGRARGWICREGDGRVVFVPPKMLDSFSGTDQETLQNIVRQCGALEAQVIRQQEFAKNGDNFPAEEKKAD